MSPNLPLISLEDHFLSEAALDSPDATKLGLHLFPKEVKDNLIAIGEQRVKDMDKGDIMLQVISHTPLLESPDVCRKANDQLAKAVIESHGRFAAFSMLPMNEPDIATEELDRCVKGLGFLGALIPNHANGRYYEGNDYWPLFERAQQLDVPIYLHPCPASDNKRPDFNGNYPPEIATVISAQGWGWHAECAVHFLRLYASGLFDHYPRLKIVLGHNGEMLPFMIERIQARLSKNWGSHSRDLMTVWNENIWFTTSGMFYLGPFSCLIRTVKMDRIMFSVDYPFEDNEQGSQFMKEIVESGLVTVEQAEMIAYRNAEKLLKIELPRRNVSYPKPNSHL